MPSLCIGRDATLAAVATCLESGRWVTLIGPPGSGKSTVARAAMARHPNPVWVSVRGMTSAEQVLVACHEALGAEHAPGDTPAGVLTRALDGVEVLLVVDDVDVDVTGLGTVLQSLLEATTTSQILATSLTLAGQPDERVVRVSAFPVPRTGPVDGPAMDMFVERLAMAGGRPVDPRGDRDALVALLTATGGLPLLIGQAAVQCALLGLSGSTPADTLAEAIDTAYALLAPEQQRALRRVSLLGFPVGPEVLSAITGDGADALGLTSGLVRRSLLEVLPDGRVELLSPIRAHAATLAQPGECEEVDRALLVWADRVVPDHENYGAADQPWLRDLPAIRHAVHRGAERDDLRHDAIALANRVFSSLYTAMHAREALDLLQGLLEHDDVPAALGSMVARRAGIAASEVHGTYEGLWLMDRADTYARTVDRADEMAKTASIRAEMHLDAGDLPRAEAEARRAIQLDQEGGSIVRQATRTLADVFLSRGRLTEAVRAANDAIPLSEANSERWITLSSRTLLARVALEQGRVSEAVAATRAVVRDAEELAEDRVWLLAETLLRGLDPSWTPREVDRDSLPWAVRLPVLAQDARDLLRAGDHQRAAGLAADVTALADSARLGRDGVEARLLLGRALLARDEVEQAATTFLTALEQAVAMPMPLRTADALDGLASVGQAQGVRRARDLAAAASAVRAPRLATAWGYAAQFSVDAARQAPTGWVVKGMLTKVAAEEVTSLFVGPPAAAPTVLDSLTASERQVADRVADGLTSRQIGGDLFISPRTVDAHLTNIYRKLDISSRAKLAALVVDNR